MQSPDLANKVAKFFDEKTDKIYKSFSNGEHQAAPTMPQQVNKKLVRFQEVNLIDLKRVIDKVKCTYCENDPFPIRAVKMQKIYI